MNPKFLGEVTVKNEAAYALVLAGSDAGFFHCRVEGTVPTGVSTKGQA